MTHASNPQHLPPEKSAREYEAEIERLTKERDEARNIGPLLAAAIQAVYEDPTHPFWEAYMFHFKHGADTP